MRGHIVKRGKDSYSVKVSLGFDQSAGRYKYQWVTVKGTKADAQKRLTELLHQLDTGVYLKPGKTTVAEYLTAWLRDYAKPSLSPRGYERYESVIRVHLKPALGHIPLTQLRPGHLQKHYTALLDAGLRPRSVRYDHVILHKALETAVKWGLVSRNVADATSPPKAGRTDIQTWDESEMGQFLETAKDTQYYALFYTALFTGARRSELLALRWSDIDFILSQLNISRGLHQLRDGRYVFTQPKSAKSLRSIALSPSAILVLDHHRMAKNIEAKMLGIELKDTDLVFCHLDGKPLRPNTVSRAWGMTATRAGVKVIRFHDARHTHASIMLKQGIHPKIVQERLGHASIQITLDTYSHVAPGLQQAAANRFDEVLSPKYNSSVSQKN